MKAIRVFSEILCITGWSVAFLFFTLYYRFAFNYRIEVNDHYFLVFSIPFLLLVVLLNAFNNPRIISVKKILWSLLVITICLLLLLSKYYSFGNEYFVVLVSVFFINTAVGFIQNKKIIYTIPTILTVVWLFELYIGIQQWLHAKSYDDNIALAIKGTLENSGVYACYLAIHLPLLNFAKENLIGKPCKLYTIPIQLLSCLALLLSAFLIYQTESRTAYITLFIILAGWVFLKYKVEIIQKTMQLSKIVLTLSLTGILALTASGAYYLFSIKKMSLMGRLMKTEIAIQHITDQFWLGTGIGRFTWYYPQWQAQYFKETPAPPKDYFLSSSESYIIFNEYLQWLETTGIAGAIITIFLLTRFFKAKAESHKSLLNTLKYTALAIMACGFTSYPLHINSLLLLLSFCFVSVFNLSTFLPIAHPAKKGGKNFEKFRTAHVLQHFFLTVSVILMGILEFKGITEFEAVKLWERARDRYLMQGYTEKYYTGLYNRLKNNGKFLVDYGNKRTQNITDHNAITILIQSQQLFISRESMEAITLAYSKKNNCPKAIEYEQWICYFLPNKFNPKFELLKLYEITKDTINIKRVANTIATMPVKIPSLKVDRIGQEAFNILKELQ
ncbi:MAG: O-antigen ligase family protein [Chitinophagaceae bacterium]|nr:O-antigen ligase family protein [Chitinophagaceae bacterium]